jgi:BirA family transcriptional regulator, biotin operon repressor / biotin---[acetyl-CoA-carboxylase] ligase
MIGLPRVHERRIDSTNERARRLAEGGAPHGTLVTADEQTAGRGRQGRSWSAPPGSAVLMSLVVRGLEERHALLPLAAAVAVCDACEEVAAVQCRIKWPNDVWIEGRKVAGILIEGRPQEGWAVLGIGVNVRTREEEFPPELREIATSLGAGSTEQVLAALLASLDRRLRDEPAAILDAWRSRDALYGQEVRWNEGLGKGAGVTEDGALLVETEDGREVLQAGEVHLHRPG